MGDDMKWIVLGSTGGGWSEMDWNMVCWWIVLGYAEGGLWNELKYAMVMNGDSKWSEIG